MYCKQFYAPCSNYICIFFFSILSFATAIIVLYIVSPHEEEIVVEEWWNKASDFNRLLNINVVFI